MHIFISFSFYMWYACISEYYYYIFQFDFVDDNAFSLSLYSTVMLDYIQETENIRFVTPNFGCLRVLESIV